MRPCPPGWPTPRHRQGSTETRRGQPVTFHQRDAGCRFHDALCIGCSHAPPNSGRARKISSRIGAVVEIIEITFHCRSASRRPELAIIALTAESWSDRSFESAACGNILVCTTPLRSAAARPVARVANRSHRGYESKKRHECGDRLHAGGLAEEGLSTAPEIARLSEGGRRNAFTAGHRKRSRARYPQCAAQRPPDGQSEIRRGPLAQLAEVFASGCDVVPASITPKLQLVKSDTWEGDLFRLASLTWSVPVSTGFGRGLRFL